MTRVQIGHLHAVFHRLWTNNVGLPGYNKNDWMELQWLLTLLLQEVSPTLDPPDQAAIRPPKSARSVTAPDHMVQAKIVEDLLRPVPEEVGSLDLSIPFLMFAPSYVAPQPTNLSVCYCERVCPSNHYYYSERANPNFHCYSIGSIQPA